jgi:hypothetical protein
MIVLVLPLNTSLVAILPPMLVSGFIRPLQLTLPVIVVYLQTDQGSESGAGVPLAPVDSGSTTLGQEPMAVPPEARPEQLMKELAEREISARAEISDSRAQLESTLDEELQRVPAIEESQAAGSVPDTMEGRLSNVERLRDEALLALKKVETGDTRTVVAVIRQFNKALQDEGIEPVVDPDVLEENLIFSERLKELNAALNEEAAKGSALDPAKIQAINSEIQRVLANRPPALLSPSLLQGVMQ